jgi:hypothetical protein
VSGLGEILPCGTDSALQGGRDGVNDQVQAATFGDNQAALASPVLDVEGLVSTAYQPGQQSNYITHRVAVNSYFAHPTPVPVGEDHGSTKSRR